MEFLLQLFADFLGTPSDKNMGNREMTEQKEVDVKIAPVAENKIEEEPVLFGLMQFH